MSSLPLCALWAYMRMRVHICVFCLCTCTRLCAHLVSPVSLMHSCVSFQNFRLPYFHNVHGSTLHLVRQCVSLIPVSAFSNIVKLIIRAQYDHIIPPFDFVVDESIACYNMCQQVSIHMIDNCIRSGVDFHRVC